jgi:hypothetical protein
LPMIAKASNASMEAVQGLRNAGVTQGAVDALATLNGNVYLGLSRNAGIVIGEVRVISPAVSSCFVRATCGELPAMTKALSNGSSVSGGISFARYIESGNPVRACPSCSDGLRAFGVRDGAGILGFN